MQIQEYSLKCHKGVATKATPFTRLAHQRDLLLVFLVSLHTEQFAKHRQFAVQWHTAQGQLGQPFHGFEFGLPPLGAPWMLRRIFPRRCNSRETSPRYLGIQLSHTASYYAFETLYWCGLRLGEMLALIPTDIDFERKIIHVTKSFQRIKGEDIITPPKTEKGIRRVLMPDFYADKMQSYIESLQLNKNDRRLFYVACTRAMESLVVEAYSENPTLVRSTALANGWFTEEEIVMLDGLVSDENS